jgi:hypothetical protein
MGKIICNHKSISKGFRPHEQCFIATCNHCGTKWFWSPKKDNKLYKDLEDMIKKSLPKEILNFTIVEDNIQTTNETSFLNE